MLYDKSLERDNCGFGLIAHIEGEPSHKVVRTAIHALARMQHRGAILADGKTGDGCGLLLQKPDRFFRIVAEERGWRLAKNYAVGMLFLNKDPELAKAARRIVEEELQRETLSIVGWRDVPTNEGVLGEIALSSLPRIEQIFVNAPAGWRPRDMERRLFIARRRIEKRLQEDKDFYVCSLSNLVNIYKGLCMPADLPRFYLDLADLRLESAICLFHQRFSTNTVPRWPLAQPFRYLAHNGEINTITGNRQWARARTYKFQTPLIPDLHDAAPFVNETGSDSSSMDNMLELLLAGGMDIIRAMRLLVPPAWQNNPDMDPDLRSFFDFNSMHMEPWDGPAGIVMSDGRYAACNLDRNGLRPARYVITKDKLITCASDTTAGAMVAAASTIFFSPRAGGGNDSKVPGRDIEIMAAQARLFTAGKLIIDPGMKSVDLPVRGFITMEMDGRQSLKLVKTGTGGISATVPVLSGVRDKASGLDKIMVPAVDGAPSLSILINPVPFGPAAPSHTGNSTPVPVTPVHTGTEVKQADSIVTTSLPVADVPPLQDFIYWQPDATGTGVEPIYVMLSSLPKSVNHKHKHYPPKGVSWKDIVNATANGGSAKFKPDVNIAEIDIDAWKNGQMTAKHPTWKVKKYDHVIGAYAGKETQWVVVKESQGVVHSHPISEQKAKEYMK